MKVGDKVVNGCINDIYDLGEIIGENEKFWFVKWFEDGICEMPKSRSPLLQEATQADLNRHKTVCENNGYCVGIREVLDICWSDIPTALLKDIHDRLRDVEEDIVVACEQRSG